MKILLVSSLYPPNVIGGAEKVVHALALDLTRDGHEVVVLTTQPEGPAHDVLVEGVLVHYLPVKNLYRPFRDYAPGPIRTALWRVIDSYNFFMIPELARVIAREKPDIVNTHNIAGLSVAIWTAVKRSGVPLIHTLHDQYLLCHRSTMFKSGKNCKSRCLDCRLLAIPRKSTSRNVDGVIAVSQFILERHRQFGYFNSAATSVIYNTGYLGQHGGRAHAYRPRTFRIGFLGQIIPTKGARELIDAFKRSELPDSELMIAGRGDSPYALALRKKTLTDGNINWLGFVDPQNFFPNIDLLVVPSIWHDTAPLVVLEAFSHGVPVLASRRGGIPELISNDTGWLFEPEKADSLRQSLIECFESRHGFTLMSLACLARARAFRTTKWSTQYVDAYEAAILKQATRKKPG